MGQCAGGERLSLWAAQSAHARMTACLQGTDVLLTVLLVRHRMPLSSVAPGGPHPELAAELISLPSGLLAMVCEAMGRLKVRLRVAPPVRERCMCDGRGQKGMHGASQVLGPRARLSGWSERMQWARDVICRTGLDSDSDTPQVSDQGPAHPGSVFTDPVRRTSRRRGATLKT